MAELKATNTFWGHPSRERPKPSAQYVRKEGVRRLARRVWEDFPLEFAKDSLHGIERDLWNVMGSGQIDGAAVASELQHRLAWLVDQDLVKVLSEAETLLAAAYYDAVAEWVRDDGIVPEFKIGDIVSVWRNGCRHLGEIVAIDEKLATYSLRVTYAGQSQLWLEPYENVEKASLP